MHKIWNYVSNLGSTDKSSLLGRREIILSNQLNFVMLIFMFLLLVTTIVTQDLTHMVLSVGTLRVAATLLLSFLNLVFARYGYTKLSRLSLIFLPSLVFLLGPTLTGYVEEEGYHILSLCCDWNLYNPPIAVTSPKGKISLLVFPVISFPFGNIHRPDHGPLGQTGAGRFWHGQLPDCRQDKYFLSIL